MNRNNKKRMLNRVNMEMIRFFINDKVNIVSANFVKRNRDSFIKAETIYIPKKHFLYYNVEGKRQIGFKGKLHNVDNDDILLFCEGFEYDSRIPESTYRAMNISFSATLQAENNDWNMEFENTCDYMYIPFIINVHGDLNIKYMFQEIVYLSMSTFALDIKKSELLLKQLLLELAARCDGERHKTLTPIEKAVDLIIKNSDKCFPIDELALKVNVSRSTLTRNFKKFTGKSVNEFQLEVKLKIAESIIQTNPYIRNAEVCKMLGFSDEYYFSHVFKKIVGVSPQEYKIRFR